MNKATLNTWATAGAAVALSATIGTVLLRAWERPATWQAGMSCSEIRNESLQRICYRQSDGSLIAQLDGLYSKHCGVPALVAVALLGASEKRLAYGELISGAYACTR